MAADVVVGMDGRPVEEAATPAAGCPWEGAVAEARRAGAVQGVLLFLDGAGDDVGRVPINCGWVVMEAILRSAARDVGAAGPERE